MAFSAILFKAPELPEPSLATSNNFFQSTSSFSADLKYSITVVVVNNDNLYIGIAGEADKNISGFTSKDNLITGKSKAKGGGGAITIEGWKEN